MEFPFEGIRVVDAASFLAGPGAATVLGDFGASVIKVEPLSGDGYRTLSGNYVVDYHWQLTSRNKRSVALDISRPEGQDIVRALVRDADVFLVNFFPRQLARYGLRYEDLAPDNPRLIYAHMSGYGTDGPDAERRAFDSTAWWARSGMMDIVRDPGQPPVMGVPGFGDHTSAMSLFGAIAMALYTRERTGRGGQVATSLLANGIWANGMQVQGAIAGFDLAALRQEKGWLNPFTSVYGTGDGRHVLLGITNPAKEWPSLCAAMGHPEWREDPRFADLRTLMRNRRELIALIAGVTGNLTLRDLVEILDSHDITYGVVSRLAEVVRDPQLKEAGILVPTGAEDEYYQWTVTNPIRMAGAARRDTGPSPGVGEHSASVLTELGLSGDEIESLAERGIVGLGGPEGRRG